ncbi:MAG: hypothetical protein R2932_55060 [Caldilineaceae bacterium]
MKAFFTGQFVRVSTATYVAMGWLALLLIKPMLTSMGLDGTIWMLAGGLSYSLGVIPFCGSACPSTTRSGTSL